MIDHKSQIPYYVQVKAVIHQRLEDGTWNAGDQLPSEAELCELFQVSRTVVRQALQDLIHEGLIVRRKGKGSFVAVRKISEQLAQKLTGFYDDMLNQGYQPVTRVLALRVVPASAEVAAHLGLEPEAEVIEIIRLRSVADTPIVYVSAFIPYALCPNLLHDDLSNQSLYALLERRYNLYIARGRRTMQAVSAEGQVAQLLRVKRGTPLFRLDSVCYLSDDTPVEYYCAYHRGDQSQFEVELVRLTDTSEVNRVSDLPPSNKIVAR